MTETSDGKRYDFDQSLTVCDLVVVICLLFVFCNLEFWFVDALIAIVADPRKTNHKGTDLI